MVSKFIYSLMLLGVILMNSSCNNEEIEPTFNFYKPCLKWGTDIQSVKEHMNGFELYKETSSELHYVGGETEKTISYHFIEGKLNTSVVVLNEYMVKDSPANTIYKGYKNEDGDLQTFINIENNTMGYTKIHTIDEEKYIVVSWTEVSFSNANHI